MDIFVRICNEIGISHMQVIEIICLKYWLNLSVDKFLSFPIKLPINLNDSRMSLILTQQNHMRSLNRIKTFTHFVGNYHLAIILILIFD